MTFSNLSNTAVAEIIGERIKARRLAAALTQQQLADKAGLSRSTVSELERGGAGNIQTFIQVLRALGELGTLDAFLPKLGPSPLEVVKLRGKERQRARPSKDDDSNPASTW